MRKIVWVNFFGFLTSFLILKSIILRLDQLRSLQQASRMTAPPSYLQKSEDELDRLTNALKRHGIECTSTLKHAYSAYANKNATSSRRLMRGHSSHSTGSTSSLNSQGISDNPACCTHSTHRCHHAAHAYTGLPCHTGNSKKKYNLQNNKVFFISN